MTEQEWLACTDPTPMLNSLRERASDRKLRLFAVACCRNVWDMFDEHPRRVVETVERYADGMASVAERRAAWESIQLCRGPTDDDIIAYWHAGSGALCAQLAASVDHTDWPWEPFTGRCMHLPFPITQFPGIDLALWCAHEIANELARRKSKPEASTKAPSRWERMTNIVRRAIHGYVPRSPVVTPQLDQQSQAALAREVFGNPFRPVNVDLAWLSPTVVSLATGIYEDRAFDRLPILADALEDAGCTSADLLNHCRQPGEHARGCWPVDLLLGKQ
jgi:hypothetical protein